MRFIGTEYKHYEELIEQIGESRIQARYQYLHSLISQFINGFGRNDISEKLRVNERILMHCVLEYFEDILKVKSAHDLDHANSPKVNAYTAYWILRRHPIQITLSAEDGKNDDLVFANEKFVLSMLMSFLTHGAETTPLLDNDLDIYKAFISSFYYFLKFRRVDPQAIEMILLSFRLGGVFPACKDIQ